MLWDSAFRSVRWQRDDIAELYGWTSGMQSLFSEADVKLTSKEVASLKLTGSGLFLHCISKLRYEESIVSLLTVL